jgi:hypothetical protein
MKKPKTLPIKSATPIRIGFGELLGVIAYIEKEKRMHRRLWKRTQKTCEGWCAFHNGVIWGLHLAQDRLKKMTPNVES